MAQPFSWTNPHHVDLTRPYIYYIEVSFESYVYRYIGKGSASGRMDAYWKNVAKALAGKAKRPALKRDGTCQSPGNLRFRYVHLVLAAAVLNGWKIAHFPLENCSREFHSSRESELIAQYKCNMNYGPSWDVEQLHDLVSQLEGNSVTESVSQLCAGLVPLKL